jgi:hypothetical protein
MSELEQIEFSKQLDYGLKMAYEKMLREKAMWGQTIIISDGLGNPVEVSAKERLERYLKEEQS